MTGVRVGTFRDVRVVGSPPPHPGNHATLLLLSLMIGGFAPHLSPWLLTVDGKYRVCVSL